MLSEAKHPENAKAKQDQRAIRRFGPTPIPHPGPQRRSLNSGKKKGKQRVFSP
jgi:hypothetical protein